MKRPLTLALLYFLLPVSPAFPENASPSYVELADAPAIAVDWSKSDTQAVTIHGNRTFAFSNGRKGGKYLLIVKQDVTGSRTVTWPASVHWPGVYPPTLTTTGDKKDYISFFYNGVTYDLVAISQGL